MNRKRPGQEAARRLWYADKYSLASPENLSMYPRAVLHLRQSRPLTHAPHDLLSLPGDTGQWSWSWSMFGVTPSNGTRHIAHAYPWSPNICSNRVSVMPYRTIRDFRCQRLRWSGVSTRTLVLDAWRHDSIFSAEAQSPSCPTPRAHVVFLRGIHLPHKSWIMCKILPETSGAAERLVVQIHYGPPTHL